MRRTIGVFLGDAGRHIGMLRYDQRGRRESAAFEYTTDWLRAQDRFAIDPALPLVAGPQFRPTGASIFHLAIVDSTPDGWARRVIRRDHLKQRNEARNSGVAFDNTPLNTLDFLLSVDDLSRVGALRFMGEDGVFRRASEPGRRTIPPLIELGRLVAVTNAIETETDTAADLAFLRGCGTSLGGMRPKCVVVDENDRLCIGKFPSVSDERAVTKGEVLALALAKKAGIDAAEARLVDSDGSPVALIRRFDRPECGGRLLYVSAATMLGVDRADPDEGTYTDIADSIRRFGNRVQRDLEELWRRIAFSILITNVDDHLQNHGFLHVSGGQWTLSPAFDINPFPERHRELKTWISEDTGPAASIDALMTIAPYFRIKRKRTKEILGEVDSAVGQWRTVGAKLGMKRTELDAFADAFEHDEREAARRVTRVTLEFPLRR
ncbi:MAG: type II toxin-antitoxin system HipA family toxin [Gemmatimonadales bacterium]|jgi:serine/threonine-protein kinase HipA|nr:type II toxin-antitoxin system HipA family toxin [Gemmatimonadales bacterium]